MTGKYEGRIHVLALLAIAVGLLSNLLFPRKSASQVAGLARTSVSIEVEGFPRDLAEVSLLFPDIPLTLRQTLPSASSAALRGEISADLKPGRFEVLARTRDGHLWSSTGSVRAQDHNWTGHCSLHPDPSVTTRFPSAPVPSNPNWQRPEIGGTTHIGKRFLGAYEIRQSLPRRQLPQEPGGHHH